MVAVATNRREDRARPMATVRQSITALYEQSQKSAKEGQAMFAVIESAAVESTDLASDDEGQRAEAEMVADNPTAGEGLSIARRFDDLRELAEREAGDIGAYGAPPGRDPSSPSINLADTPDTPARPMDEANIGVDTSYGAIPDLALPSEPPAPAAGDSLSELDVANIQELVRQAWEDETALATSKPVSGLDAVAHEVGQNDGIADHNHDDPDHGDHNHDIDAAMEEIAAAVVTSGNVTASVDLASMKAELVAAMRTELQDVLAADLRPMIKAAIAEAMQDLPVTQPKTRAKKAAPGKSSSGRASSKKLAAKKTSDN